MADWLDILHTIRNREIAQPEPSSEAVFTNAAYEAMGTDTIGLWKYHRITGLWRLERTCTRANADQWLHLFQRDAPHDTFRLSKVKPFRKPAVDEAESCASCGEAQPLKEAEYQGRKVTLNDPFRTPDGPKKFAVYVKNDNGNVIKLGFGDPNLSIKRDDPERRKNFLARHNCSDPGPKWKAKYWSCNWGWGKKPISDKLKE